MPIKRKDGSIYKLRGPNKLMKNQSFWATDEVVLIHNFDNLSEEVIDLGPIKQEINHDNIQIPSITTIDTTLNVEQPIIKKEEEPVIEDDAFDKIEPIKTENSTAKIETNDNLKAKSQFRKGEKELLFCLPAITSSFVDPLYGEKVNRLEYDDPFKFQSVIVSVEDTKMTIWTTVQQVTRKSIIFHPTRYRWWSVDKIYSDQNGDGLVLSCIPSEVKPDFTNS